MTFTRKTEAKPMHLSLPDAQLHTGSRAVILQISASLERRTRTGAGFGLIRRQFGGVSLVLLANGSLPTHAPAFFSAVVAFLDSGLAFTINHCPTHPATGDDWRDHAL